MRLKSLRDIDCKDKRILVRVDFNCPLNEKNEITDSTRIEAALPTILYILDQGGSIVLMSHLGRPTKGVDPKLSLAPIAKKLSSLINRAVIMAPDCIGESTLKLAKHLKAGELLLLENLRFHPEEEANDPIFASQLARLGDIYINDAFGAAHRAHASTVAITHFSPLSAAGFLLEKEVTMLSTLLISAKHPFYAIIGGSKISAKLGVLEALLQKIDGLFIGSSLLDPRYKDTLLLLSQKCSDANVPLHLPVDLIIASELTEDASTAIHTISSAGIPPQMKGGDIGPATIKKWRTLLEDAQTVFWNGPVGVFEKSPFKEGTCAIAKILAELPHANTIIGGGDSAAAVAEMGFTAQITYISTGGGASLEFLETGTLPALTPLLSP